MKKKKMYVLDIVALVAAVILIGLTGLVSSCAVSRGQGDDTKEVTLYGLGDGKAFDKNIARGVAKTAALGELSLAVKARVKSVTSNYFNLDNKREKCLYESLADSYTDNTLKGVVFKGDRHPVRRNLRGEYVYSIEARITQEVLKQNLGIYENYLTREQRQAFREEMMGSGNY